ncbi:hypothetical protein [Niabella ginsengisoli]|uniref:Uncharacterized protein n=1 Tax=Niabella ginsengisoli TaxID=522298 RepID=A0ABS9SN72_9BACT|nr:hypothetical protein [Niabella ginsengisoli]MCH5599810.1 hypothetical protein [Niabella ginsengisoli]
MIIKIGNNVKFVDMDLESIYNNLNARKHFTNLNPNANFNYKFNNYKAINISYNGSANNPERSQMLPFNYNNTQVTTFLPNLDLRNSFTNNINGYFYESKILTSVYYGANGGYTRISNPIVQSILVSPSGTYNYQYVNMEGYTNGNYYFNTYYSKK